MVKVKKISIWFISMIMMVFMLQSCVFSAPDSFTPSEKVQFTTMKGLQTAYDFRIFALNSAKTFWDQGLMDIETKDKIVKLGDEFQKAINDTSIALEKYRTYNGVNSSDLESKISLYQDLYVQFNTLIMPYIIKRMED